MRRLGGALALAVLAAGPPAYARTQCGPLDAQHLAPLLAPGDAFAGAFCARFPASLVRYPGQAEGALVVSPRGLEFFLWRHSQYEAPVLRKAWKDVACAWVERYEAFYERFLGVEFEDGRSATFSIGRSLSSDVRETLDALARIDAAHPPDPERAACSRIRASGDYRHGPSGFVLPAKPQGLERWEIRRSRAADSLSAVYDRPRSGSTIELAIHPLSGSETLSATLDRALAAYRGPKTGWSESEIRERQITVAGARTAALPTRIVARDVFPFPGRRLILALHASRFAVVVDATYDDGSLRAIERTIDGLLESLAPATPPSP